ncbi:phosphoglucomutase/phosphomannomutase, alpha/beta/alpha domain II [Treponema vincentii ATCC 35580]|uniref:Phosphoglucomutase/phosphomannomutase, alpha/beta/alpha domain II n=1 Tax=Treponema vincentii ATCC 35580 TaxID=596324 RepID=C8PM93_9SPIR|nr:phosphoglucomutase [Treponema vincentii]EEV21310.1 phosphoglucomutase/phosphomannomutase, alpha/beta/alpha domain II [Treponema vincentii ATCC 35580]
MTEHNVLKLQNGSDIRGVALEGVDGEHVNLTPDVCRSIGAAFASWLAAKIGRNTEALVIGIGRDSRLSGEALEQALVEGLAPQQVTIVRCSLATTPAMFMGTVFEETNFDGSIMITASHLPFNRNGFKFFDKSGGLERSDITEILRAAAALHHSGVPEIAGDTPAYTESPAVQVGHASSPQCRSFDLIALYSEHLRNAIRKGLNFQAEKPLAGLKIAVDAGNGAGGFFAEQVLKPLGADISGSRFLEPDGTFPNHIPNPENKAAMEAAQAAVIQSGSDLGLIFDTDVDRMSAVLSDGTEVNRDAIIAMTAAILAPAYPHSTIVTDSVTSDRLTFFLERELGLTHLRYMRGYKNVINKCRELNEHGITSPLAMETSGHGALKENYYLDDGAFLAVKLVTALANAKHTGKNIESLIEKLPPLVEEAELRFKIGGEDFKDYGTAVLQTFKERAEKAGFELPQSYEGVRISFNSAEAQGWMLLRLSLHDPVMPLNIESTRKGGLAKLKAIARTLLDGFDRLDISPLN